MAYLFLALAILCEVIGAIASTYAEGFKKTIPSMIVTLAIIASYYFFAVSLQYGMNIGVGYAIWAGVGVLSSLHRRDVSKRFPYHLANGRRVARHRRANRCPTWREANQVII